MSEDTVIFTLEELRLVVKALEHKMPGSEIHRKYVALLEQAEQDVPHE